MKQEKLNGPQMILPLVFLLILFGGCTADSDCKFGARVNTPSTIPQGLGVNVHFTDPQPGEVKMIADAGFRWVRMDFKWDVTERERGRYDFAAYDRLMKALDQYRITPLFILDYGNPLYDHGGPPRTAETQQAFAHWAVAAATHFSSRGVIWEIYNEPNNAMFWPPQPNADEYVQLALAVARAFRSDAPGEKLIGPGVSQIDVSFLDACFKSGLLDYWSGVSVHPYRKSDPETAALEYCRVRKLMQRYQTQGRKTSANPNLAEPEIPIISGEWGYSAVWRGLDEEQQGALFAREMLTNLANGIVLSIWYDWRDDGSDTAEAEHHFGLVRNTYQTGRDQVYEPKPAYRAAQTFNAYFNGYLFEQRLVVGRDDDYVLVFNKGGDRRLAAWTTSTSAHRINIPFDQGQFTLTRHTGESSGPVAATSKNISIEVSTDPVYLSRAR